MIFDRCTDTEKFVAVAEAGSVFGAATAPDITQPGLSRVIKRLERRCGRALFRRTTRGVMLTDFGLTALECARQLLRAHHEAEAVLTGVPPDKTAPKSWTPTLTPEEHARFSIWLDHEAGRRSPVKVLMENAGSIADAPRDEISQLAVRCVRGEEDGIALRRVADIVRTATRPPKA